MVDLYSLDVAVERERARRLVDRFGRDDSEGGELARERRAHNVSAAVRRELDRRQSTGSNPEALANLEASLDARSRSNLQHMLQEASLQIPAPAIVPIVPRAVAQVERGPSPPEDSAKVTSRALQGSLDDISVKSLLDFRSVGANVFAAESVATAATCAIANLDDTVRVKIKSLDPDCPWPGALQVLSKPGHFINSLREFPKAVEQRRVPEDNMVAARHYLSIAPPKNAEFHPAVRNLSRWVGNAIRYWEHHSGEKDDADYDRRQPSLAAGAREAERHLAERQAAELGVGFGGASASNASPTPSHRPPTAAAPTMSRSVLGSRSTLPARSPPGDPNRGTASTGNLKHAFAPKARPSASPRTRASAPAGGPPTSTRMTSSPSRGISSTIQAIRSGVTSTTLPRSSSGVSTPSPLVASAVRPTPSPHSRRYISPRQTPVANGNASTTDAPRRHVPVVTGSVNTTDSSRVRSPLRPSVALRPSTSGSPAPTRSSPRRSPRSPMAKSPSERLAVSKSASSLVRQVKPVLRNSNGQIVPAIPMVNGSQPVNTQEFRRMLDETKREVREIKAIESQLKWNMQREEKKEKSADVKAQVEELRDWRWRQDDEMKAYRTAKAQTCKVSELKESKSFQEFKREVKDRYRSDERRQVEEMYLQDRENAQWRADLVRVAHEKEKHLVAERVEEFLENREIRTNQKLQERLEADENRAIEQALEMQQVVREIQSERDQVLQNLAHSRSACHRSPQRNAYPPSPELGRLS